MTKIEVCIAPACESLSTELLVFLFGHPSNGDKFTVNTRACNGNCSGAPVVFINDEEFAEVTREILEEEIDNLH